MMTAKLEGRAFPPIFRALERAVAILVLAVATSCQGSGGDGAGETLGRASQAILVSAASNQIGRLTSSGAGATRTYTQYDALGRVTAAEHVLDRTSYIYKTSFGYPQSAVTPPAGSPGTVTATSTYPDGETVSYSYDASGAQQAVHTAPCLDTARHTDGSCASLGGPQTIVAGVQRNVRGQTTKLLLGDGTEQDHFYNESTNLRLNQITSFVTNLTSKVLQDLSYDFDANGNVTAIADNLTGRLSATYAYDSLSQVTSMSTTDAPYSYAYDNLGNLTTKEGATQSYGGTGRGPHALESSAGLTYTYDANGNLVNRTDGMTVVWNAENMPMQLSGGPVTGTTKKSFVGESQWKKVQGSTTTYYLPSERIESGAAQAHKYFGTFAERDIDGSLKYYHPDHLGSSTLVTDASGTVVHRAAYLPYGGDRSVANYTPAYTESFTPKYQFNFKEKEQDGTSFYDYGARLFNPATGRWLSADTSSADGPNRYAYVSNNPLRYTDPTGHTQQSHSQQDDDLNEIFGMSPGWQTAHDLSQLAGPGGSVSFGLIYSVAHPLQTFDQLGVAAMTLAVCVVGHCPDPRTPRGRVLLLNMGVQYVGIAAGPVLKTLAGPKVPGQKILNLETHTPAPAAGAARGGWTVGDDIWAKTARGKDPAWSTVRSRFWKNEAAAEGAAERWGAGNVERMRGGAAPRRYNPDKGGYEAMELSHEPIPAREGGRAVVPRWPQDHAAVDPYRKPGY